MRDQVLIATLGTEPQVITLVLDLLRAKGYPVAEVIVIHTTGDAVRPALNGLAVEFSDPRTCPFRLAPIQDERGPVADIVTETDTMALLRTLYRTVLGEKRAGRLVHLSIAGGRKPMAVYGMVVSQLLLDENDRVWHLLSEGWRPGDERVMHPQPGLSTSLVPVPVLRWSTISPALTELALRDDPWEAIQAQRTMQQEDDRRRKRDFLEYVLTPAERRAVRLASQGLDNAAIARQLGKSEKTINNQFTGIYQKLHEWRGYRTDVPVSRSVLVAEFAPYFALERR
ncbi:MAG: CRISPR-associated protein Csx14 [Anaerolineae bacterium]|nr:CRISPR-associated protein Csx14 [Anaerolineae bacterium]